MAYSEHALVALSLLSSKVKTIPLNPLPPVWMSLHPLHHTILSTFLKSYSSILYIPSIHYSPVLICENVPPNNHPRPPSAPRDAAAPTNHRPLPPLLRLNYHNIHPALRPSRCPSHPQALSWHINPLARQETRPPVHRGARTPHRGSFSGCRSGGTVSDKLDGFELGIGIGCGIQVLVPL